MDKKTYWNFMIVLAASALMSLFGSARFELHFGSSWPEKITSFKSGLDIVLGLVTLGLAWKAMMSGFTAI